ncbi:hypothetical protein E2C01_048255 [Portunus trituberculatus]|uniref:Uncharacterized protein n=1 Tax=Portunus trituberculatus TaxID=210409 RepID=A0A5B7GAC2_PORTR|nr:hypothetical protein [Portunus trituberculatus]
MNLGLTLAKRGEKTSLPPFLLPRDAGGQVQVATRGSVHIRKGRDCVVILNFLPRLLVPPRFGPCVLVVDKHSKGLAYPRRWHVDHPGVRGGALSGLFLTPKLPFCASR